MAAEFDSRLMGYRVSIYRPARATERADTMSTKHIATLPDGQIVTRTSKGRTYLALVAVGPQSREVAAESARTTIAYQVAQAAKYAAVVNFLEAGGKLVPRTSDYGSTHHYLPGATSRSESIYVPNGSATPEEGALIAYKDFLASTLDTQANTEARLAEILAGPALVGTAWHVSGWNGTEALAAKAARSQMGYGCEVRVITDIERIVK